MNIYLIIFVLMFSSIDLLSILIIFYHISFEILNVYIVLIFTVSNYQIFKMAAESHFIPKISKAKISHCISKICTKMFVLVRSFILKALFLLLCSPLTYYHKK